MADRLQASRFELKYLITEEIALRLRDYVRAYLDVDEYGANAADFAYPIHSIYLDSDTLRLYYDTLSGQKNRLKLRLRYYDDRPDSPIFLEIKKRMNNTIIKQRVGIRKNRIRDLLEGDSPTPNHLLTNRPEDFLAAQTFCNLMQGFNAKPKVHVFYMREAWISTEDNSLRVTMDRNVLTDLEPAPYFSTRMLDPVLSYPRQVILELKFTNRFPDWFRELAQAFRLEQCGAAKYVSGVMLLGEHRVKHSFPLEGFVPMRD